MFEIKNKVALISGGASGIGFHCARALLQQGCKGVCLADINEEGGKAALRDFEKEFGPKVLFVKTDVTKKESYEEAFKKTVERFENLDILINNAGIANDETWEKEIAINLNGTIIGTILGLENYLQKYRSGPEAVILNMSSVAGVIPFPAIPIYSATKFGVIGASKSFGGEGHYQRTKVRVLALCPNFTDTPLLAQLRTLGPHYDQELQKIVEVNPTQKVESVADAAVKIIKTAPSGSAWVSQYDSEPREYQLNPL